MCFQFQNFVPSALSRFKSPLKLRIFRLGQTAQTEDRLVLISRKSQARQSGNRKWNGGCLIADWLQTVCRMSDCILSDCRLSDCRLTADCLIADWLQTVWLQNVWLHTVWLQTDCRLIAECLTAYCLIADWLQTVWLQTDCRLSDCRLSDRKTVRVLGVFAKLRKEISSFVMSVRPCGTTRLPMNVFRWNLVFECF